jgi:arylsulfatase A-like enzyme/tetratricopeptide (TPR) repeat protein
MDAPAPTLSLAVQYLQSEKRDAAAEICRNVLADNPQNADARNLLGLVAIQAGNYEQAANHFLCAIRLRNGVAAFHLNLGLAYQSWKKLDEAIACFRQAVKLGPEVPEAHHNLANALRERSKIPEAIPPWRRVRLVALLLVAVLAVWAVSHFLHGRRQPEAGDKDNPTTTADGAPAGINATRNVLLISIDTCRADHLSCYGYKRQTTPNIDAVAREGAMFKMALTPVPITTPAHSSMLTGTYPPTHGVHFNTYDHLADSNVTLAKTLRDAGYQTAAFVGAFPLDARFGLNQGFDTYDGRFTDEGKKGFFSRRVGEEVNRPAMAWLEGHAQKPFFLFLHYFDCHSPYAPHPPDTSPYGDDPYAGEIAYIDHCIGGVLDRLRALGVYDNTLVIITGDHGESLGEHGELTHTYFIYQCTLHVPLVIRTPGCGKGIKVEGNVNLVDIVPTVLDLVGLKIPSWVEGADLRPALEGGPAPDNQRAVYIESLEAATYGCSALHGIVQGPWKYILAPRPELYDLTKDPGELTNLAGMEPQVTQRLRGCLAAMFKELERAAPRRGPLTVDQEAVKRLRSLGYVSGGATMPVSAMDTTREDPKDFLPTYKRLVNARSHIDDEVGRDENKKELLEIATRRPGLVEPYQLLALIAMSERRLADAAGHYARVVAMLDDLRDPPRRRPGALEKLAEAHSDLGIVLWQLGKRSEAIGHCEQALRIKPDYVEAHFNLGIVLWQLGKLPEAIGHYEQALRIRPDYAEAHLNLGTALQQASRLPEAIMHCEQALRIKPDYAEAHFNLGNVLLQLSKLPEAIGHYEQALRIKPDYAKALLNLGIALQQAGRLPEAIGNFEQALRTRPDDAVIHYNLAVALELEGAAAKAAGHYAEAIQNQADFLAALNRLASIRATSEDPQLRNGPEAVRLAQRAYQFTGHREVDTLDTLAAAYAEAGRFPEAVQTARQALNLAIQQNKLGLAEFIRAKTRLYEAGKPFHESPPSPARPHRP